MRSKTVDGAIKRLFATLATAAAKKALGRLEWNDAPGADAWAAHTIRWLDKAGADATKWHYTTPGQL